MMIAKSWMDINSECRRSSPRPRVFSTIERMSAGEVIQRVMPSKRDREVPYGMKGGEQDGREEESCC
jgi:hypothetical protein